MSQSEKLNRLIPLVLEYHRLEQEIAVILGESIEAPAWKPDIPKLKKIAGKLGICGEKQTKNKYGIVHPCCMSKQQRHKKTCKNAVEESGLPPVTEAKCIDCDLVIDIEEPFDWKTKCECGGNLIPK